MRKNPEDKKLLDPNPLTLNTCKIHIDARTTQNESEPWSGLDDPGALGGSL